MLETEVKIETPLDAETQALDIRSNLGGLTIVDDATYEAAANARQDAVRWIKAAGDWWDGLVKPAYENYKNLLHRKKAVIEPVEQQILQVNNALRAYKDEQDRKARQAQMEAEAAARKAAEDQRLADAEHMQEMGASPEVIENLLDAPVQVSVPVSLAVPTTPSSVSYRDNWKARVTSLPELIKAAAKRKDLQALLQINESALNAMARAMKDQLDIPGVEVYNDKVVVTGRG